jgi:hypothetical protein
VRNVKAGVAAATALLVLGVGASSASAKPFDSVVGGGSNGNPTADNHFVFAAKSDADGSDPRGFFAFIDTQSGPPTEYLQADIRCLRVSGSLATAVGQIVRNRNNGNLAGRYMIVRLEDNGPPRGGDSDDEIRNALLPVGAPEPACPVPADIPDRGLSHGNIVINDAP